ncbi:glycosyl transferase family 1 [Microtetraspora sp. NBRC 13810]|uniref:glycosyltransferase n=1 Tax=Microtetraspora sp. NBRC 13810 TaxID=3030990 RepID=UPI0024A20AD3|nr:glycosyltransferase [Microtetraspora sp. NBRC 13810]GLW05852.1 glycosyl transferase family 1 [Microtetraspora sp. NBRC 13810]
MTENGKPRGVLALTPFFLYPDHKDKWEVRFDPMGGMHLLGYSIVQEMARRGFPHRVLTMAPPGVPKDVRMAANVSVHARRLPVLPIPSKLEGYFGLVGAWAKASLGFVLTHRARLRQEIGLVHAHCDGSGSAPAYSYAAAQILGVPLVTHIYSSRCLTQYPTTLFERVSDPVAKNAERLVMQKSDAVLTLSEDIRLRVRDEVGVPDHMAHVLAHVPSDSFVSNDTPERRAELKAKYKLDDRPIVVYLGRIASEKGVEWFVQAAAEVKKRGRRCQFVVAGDGPQRGDIEQLARRLGVADDLVITGFLPHEMVPSMLALSTMAILPSEYEELGVVIIEFMLMNLPVIAHDVSGVHKLVDHEKTGLLVEPFKPPLLADAIERLLDNPELRSKLAETAAPLPQAYTQKAAGERLEAIYRKLLKEI